MPYDGERFVIENYAEKEPFCSFLPGIAGKNGIPLWCFYVNRGQGICSFGVESKDRAIMEFYPAHQAYRNTPVTGFRTFLRVDGKYCEPFSDPALPHAMRAGMNDLELSCVSPANGLKTEVAYFALPGERLAALVRKVTLTNSGEAPLKIDMLDGMPEILPFGLNLFAIKEMTQTAKAWMQAEDTDSPVVFYKVRASMEDSSDVRQVTGVRFAAARDEGGRCLPVFSDARHIFAQRTDMLLPAGFLSAPWEEWRGQSERAQNMLPCAFCGDSFTLQPGESRSHFLLIGEAENKDRARALCEKLSAPGRLEEKRREAIRLTEELTDRIATRTGDPVFDAYCRQTYLDNLLRGGVPVQLPGGKMTYMYSRKHGDPERDYNAFRVRAEYYSQGNGNFRDVNQNRRCDVLFDPATEEKNIRLFTELIQADGYNPLIVEGITFSLPGGAPEELLSRIGKADRESAKALLSRSFTPGELRMAAEDWTEGEEEAEKLFADILACGTEDRNATFGEGYWSDHWTYNLDQVESFLSIWPEREEALLYDSPGYTWYQSGVSVLPRAKRYRKTERGIRQFAFLESEATADYRLHGENGEVIRSSLAARLFSLAAVKAATLDPAGMGIEMEGGKPGWYDALNGLPGLLGSSVAELAELSRLIAFLTETERKWRREIALPEEVYDLAEAAAAVCAEEKDAFRRWERLSDLREEYRARIRHTVTGKEKTLSPEEVLRLLEVWQSIAEEGLQKGLEQNNGLYPTYFAYEVTDYSRDENGILPKAVRQVGLPDFLEGQVRCLRLDLTEEQKVSLTEKVRAGHLYDRKLKMYKVNADLADAGYEIGRAHAFTPGWLENESVWLHMEYKYLLEELRSGLYEQFAADLDTALIPFLKEETYGRSLLENSSFIASSANPDERIHGKGFVARLSGSTAEFLSMWQIMLHGKRMFTLEDGELVFRLAPVLPACLTKGTDCVTAALFDKTRIRYTVRPGRAYYPGGYSVGGYTVEWKDGTTERFEDGIRGEKAAAIRAGEAKTIAVILN